MNQILKFTLVVLFIVLTGFNQGEHMQKEKIDVDKATLQGFLSKRPAKSWEEFLVTGNGTMGAMVVGQVYHDDITFNQTQLFLPFHHPLLPSTQGDHFDKIRQMMLDRKYLEAAQFVVDLSSTEGYNGKYSSDLEAKKYTTENILSNTNHWDYKKL